MKKLNNFIIISMIVILLSSCTASKHILLKFDSNDFSKDFYKATDIKNQAILITNYYNELINIYNQCDEYNGNTFKLTDKYYQYAEQVKEYSDSINNTSNDNTKNSLISLKFYEPYLKTAYVVAKLNNLFAGDTAKNKEIFIELKNSIRDAFVYYTFNRNYSN